MASELAVWAEGVPPEDGRRPSSRPVDLVHLSRYKRGERALEREVLELFCTQSLVYLERLREAESDKDWRTPPTRSKAPLPQSAPGGAPRPPSAPRRYRARP